MRLWPTTVVREMPDGMAYAVACATVLLLARVAGSGLPVVPQWMGSQQNICVFYLKSFTEL